MSPREKLMTVFRADRLAEIRLEAGYTQEGLAEKINFSKKQISAWETGETDPRADSLIALARFFHVSIDWFLGLSDKRAEQSRGSLTTEQRRYLNAFEKGDVEAVVTMVMDKLRKQRDEGNR